MKFISEQELKELKVSKNIGTKFYIFSFADMYDDKSGVIVSNTPHRHLANEEYKMTMKQAEELGVSNLKNYKEQ